MFVQLHFEGNKIEMNWLDTYAISTWCIGVGADPAGPFWSDHFFGDLMQFII